ncbi:MAG: hypothetical protein ABIY62_06690 [Ginsengibacter sp.]
MKFALFNSDKEKSFGIQLIFTELPPYFTRNMNIESGILFTKSQYE